MPKFEVVPGERIQTTTNTFPCKRYWYRHDSVYADGVKLEGFIQVRVFGGKHPRTDTTTCFRNTCVLGSNPQWLHRMNQRKDGD